MKALFLTLAIMLMAVVAMAQVNIWMPPADSLEHFLHPGDEDNLLFFNVNNNSENTVVLKNIWISTMNLNYNSPAPLIDFRLHNLNSNQDIQTQFDNLFSVAFTYMNEIIPPNQTVSYGIVGSILPGTPLGASFRLGLSGPGTLEILEQNTNLSITPMVSGEWGNWWTIIQNPPPPTNFLWSYSDTLYLLPQECLGAWAGIQTTAVNYFEFTSSVSGAMVTNYTMSAFTEDVLDYLGHFEYQEGTLFMCNWVSDNPYPTELSIPVVYIYVNGLNYDNIPSPGDLNTAQFYVDFSYNVQWYNNGVWEATNGVKNITVRFHNRKKGDVNHDENVTESDLSVLMYGYLHGYQQYQLDGNNLAAGNILVPWVSPFNMWLLNVWLQNHFDPLVVNLGIGQDFPLTSGTYQDITPVINDRTITINPEGQNTFSVLGRHQDGSDWTETIQINGEQRNHWTASQAGIEPTVEQNNRTDVQFTMPDDVTFVRAIATTLGAFTSNSDQTISVTIPVLQNAYPNPFNATTSISYSLPKAGNVTIEVYNIKGQKVRTLVNETKSGSNSVTWNGTDDRNCPVATGVYFYKMKSGSYTSTKKMILVK